MAAIRGTLAVPSALRLLELLLQHSDQEKVDFLTDGQLADLLNQICDVETALFNELIDADEVDDDEEEDDDLNEDDEDGPQSAAATLEGLAETVEAATSGRVSLDFLADLQAAAKKLRHDALQIAIERIRQQLAEQDRQLRSLCGLKPQPRDEAAAREDLPTKREDRESADAESPIDAQVESLGKTLAAEAERLSTMLCEENRAVAAAALLKAAESFSYRVSRSL